MMKIDDEKNDSSYEDSPSLYIPIYAKPPVPTENSPKKPNPTSLTETYRATHKSIKPWGRTDVACNIPWLFGKTPGTEAVRKA